ncbi:hypothetical protein [Nocardia jinanensis]|uniref:Uncharacterized protein n=1 Tax=Nocardia jinanensis TaxID=382504 RepID=A0A917VXN4_9NOCA|nr:hypothetical protein [Nocardia jinanensis]GGL32825.1 hypothetical protein GCM10011588_54590 [Nocardia jinanensis]
MKWICEDPNSLEDRGLHLVESWTYASPQPTVAQQWPMRYRVGMRLLRAILPAPVETYKLNLFETVRARNA